MKISKSWRYFFFFILLMVSVVWLAVVYSPSPALKIVNCDVGQGDAAIVIYKTTQIVIDGGPNNEILECISNHIPFWDRSIEMVILSHPQKDHFQGLIEVVKRFDVANFLGTELDSSTPDYRVLKELLKQKDVAVVNPRSGMKLRVGMIYLDIVWPQSEFLAQYTEEIKNQGNEEQEGQGNEIPKIKKTGVLGAFTSRRDPNDFSVVVIVKYGDFQALFTGDIGPEINNQLSVNPLIKNLEYIKVPHHGSKNGLTEKLLKAVNPSVAVISAGKGNSYGHPHEEVIKLLRDKEIKILRTDEMGDVQVETDGQKIFIKN